MKMPYSSIKAFDKLRGCIFQFCFCLVEKICIVIVLMQLLMPSACNDIRWFSKTSSKKATQKVHCINKATCRQLPLGPQNYFRLMTFLRSSLAMSVIASPHHWHIRFSGASGRPLRKSTNDFSNRAQSIDESFFYK